jgi:peroxiredoxin (alkyl hydroperoxide reductase subunit C)
MSNLISKQAPDFRANALNERNEMVEDFSLSIYKGKYVILFFYPLDFTFVCPTEIIAFDEKINEFNERNAVVIGVSIDSVYTHLAWKKTPIEEGGIGHINYPLVSDLNKDIAKKYEVLMDDGTALRGLFLIDKNGIIRHSILNDPSIGRNVNETLRILDAVQHFDNHGKVCPANWEKGEDSLDPSTEGVVDYLSKFAKRKESSKS